MSTRRNTSELRRRVDALLADRRNAISNVENEEDAISQTKLDLVNAEKAAVILQTVAQAVQQQAHLKLDAVVSRCLETVFEEPYVFRIHFDRKRGSTEARMVFEREGKEVDPMTASGGGVVDVAAFALRLACLMLSKPKHRKLLILDEPFKMLSEEYRPRVASMLDQLAEELKAEFILVTHAKEFMRGKVVRL
jgi:DNA repair exonuclease SbcCD ATPase subunit